MQATLLAGQRMVGKVIRMQTVKAQNEAATYHRKISQAAHVPPPRGGTDTFYCKNERVKFETSPGHSQGNSYWCSHPVWSLGRKGRCCSALSSWMKGPREWVVDWGGKGKTAGCEVKAAQPAK